MVASTCGEIRSTGPVSSSGARSAVAAVVTDLPLRDQSASYSRRVGAVDRGQGGDRARLVERFDHPPARARRPARCACCGPLRRVGPASRAARKPGAHPLPPRKPTRAAILASPNSSRWATGKSEAHSGEGSRGRSRRQQIGPHRQDARLPAGRPSICATTSTARRHRPRSRCAPAPGRRRRPAAVPVRGRHLRDIRQRLHDAAVAGHRGQVHQVGRVGVQGGRRVVERHPAVIDGRQWRRLESVRGHHRQVGAVFAGQAGQRPAARRPAAQQQIQRVQRAGGEHHLGVGHAGQARRPRRVRRPAPVRRPRRRRTRRPRPRAARAGRPRRAPRSSAANRPHCPGAARRPAAGPPAIARPA